jgi:hypothetical protein
VNAAAERNAAGADGEKGANDAEPGRIDRLRQLIRDMQGADDVGRAISLNQRRRGGQPSPRRREYRRCCHKLGPEIGRLLHLSCEIARQQLDDGTRSRDQCQDR